MNLMIIILGIACIIGGIWLILFYQNLEKNERGGFSFKLRTAGIGMIIIGIGLIVKNCS